VGLLSIYGTEPTQPAPEIFVKKLLVIGLLLIPQAHAYGATPKFNPLTGKIEVACDLACSLAKLNAKPKDRMGQEILTASPSPATANTHKIVIKDLEHSHLGTVSDLTTIDLKNNHLDSSQLKNIKSEIQSFLSGVEFPSHLSAMGDKFRADTARDLENMTQEQLIASMIAIADVSKTLGQNDLHSGAGFFLNGLAPEVSNYLQKHEGFETDKHPMLSIQINARNISAAFKKMNEGGSFSSHTSGIEMYSRGGSSDQWSEDDRAHAAVVNSFKRGLEFGSAGITVGAVVGSILPGLGTVTGGATGGALGATGGAIWGAIEGDMYPELGGTKPTGTKTTTDVVRSSKTESVKDEKTGKITTTVTEIKTTTVTTENLKTGEVKSDTVIVETPIKTEACSGKKCESDGDQPSGDDSCDDPYDLEYRSIPLTPEEAEAEKIRFKQQADLIKSSLILLTEPRYQDGTDAGQLAEFGKQKNDSLINPGFSLDNQVSIPGSSHVRFDPLFDPQRETMKVRSGK
jgi:hypothetical protein